MNTNSSLRTWSDDQLINAVKNSTSWLGVMRALGLKATSAAQIRVVRRHAERLKLDTSHIRGKRRWSDDQLRQAVSECRSWDDVITRLGLSTDSGNIRSHIKSHTIRLGLDTDHLTAVRHVSRQPPEAVPLVSALCPEPKHLRVAAPVTAAAWFMLRGCTVSFPAEPAMYDLLVDTPERLTRVQVKSTTCTHKNNGWIVGVGHHPDTHAKKKGYVLAYSPDEIDLFFIIDGDMTMYLIPSWAIAGRIRILLRTYRKYIVGNARGLLGIADSDAGSAELPASA